MRSAFGTRRFVAQHLDKATMELFELPVGVVSTASPLTVNWRGALLRMRRLDSYTPAVGDVVTLARSGGTWIVLGKTV